MGQAKRCFEIFLTALYSFAHKSWLKKFQHSSRWLFSVPSAFHLGEKKRKKPKETDRETRQKSTGLSFLSSIYCSPFSNVCPFLSVFCFSGLGLCHSQPLVFAVSTLGRRLSSYLPCSLEVMLLEDIKPKQKQKGPIKQKKALEGISLFLDLCALRCSVQGAGC